MSRLWRWAAAVRSRWARSGGRPWRARWALTRHRTAERPWSTLCDAATAVAPEQPAAEAVAVVTPSRRRTAAGSERRKVRVEDIPPVVGEAPDRLQTNRQTVEVHPLAARVQGRMAHRADFRAERRDQRSADARDPCRSEAVVRSSWWKGMQTTPMIRQHL